MRLIDADRLEKLVSEHRSSYCHKEDVIAGIAKQPTVDAVEVMRCIDCNHLLKDGSSRKYHLCMRLRIPQRVNLDDFCSYGERKEGADNV